MYIDKKRLFNTVFAGVIFAVFLGAFVRILFVDEYKPKAQAIVISTETDAVASSSDADTNLYMSYNSGSGIFQQIYSILLSIRNVLIMFFGFWFLAWAYARMKIVIKLFYKKRR